MKRAVTRVSTVQRTPPMRPRFLLRSILLPVILLAACESATGPAARAGQIAGTWAGERFEGSANATILRDTLFLWGSSPGEGLNDIVVNVSVAGYRGGGGYRVAPGQAGVAYVIGGDGILASYTVPTGGSGVLVVEPAANGTISGRFSFEAVPGYGNPPAGSRARFSGRFQSVPVTQLP